MAKRERDAFPWGEAMAFGLGVLRLPPAAFWAMTPRELAAAMGTMAMTAAGAPSRADLDTLIAAHPDQRTP